jgi:hypothetical protein
VYLLCTRREGAPLHQLFTSFPRGISGAGLLLLRLTIGSIAALQSRAYFVAHATVSNGMWLSGSVALMLCVALVVGFATRPVAALTALCAIGTGISWLPCPEHNSLDGLLAVSLIVSVSIALTLIGPGAYSMDARLFGFREITIPRRPKLPPRA